MAIGALISSPMPVANAQVDQIAGWLTKAYGPVSNIHQTEGTVLAAVFAKPPAIDKLEPACGQLKDAKTALQGQLPSPDPKLTAEVQQAVDDFESAADSCSSAVKGRGSTQKSDLKDVMSYLQAGEQHLASADTILAGIAKKG
ncbi:MAG TPA: hypothetical protein VH496_19005 [Mycobacterium sp.]